MKCPRNKFVGLDYSLDIEKQKQALCLTCNDYTAAPWGKHCKATLACIKCGAVLSAQYFFSIPKEDRATVTHGICDDCRKILNKLVADSRTRGHYHSW